MTTGYPSRNQVADESRLRVDRVAATLMWMNLSELDFHLDCVDVDAVVARLQKLSAENGWHMSLREREVCGPITYIWGRFIKGPEEWAEAHDEVNAGLGEITALEVPSDDGSRRTRPTFLYHSPYRDQVVAALCETGLPIFDWTTHIVEAEISWNLEAPSLKISLDRRTGHSAVLGGQRGDALFIFSNHSWVLPLGQVGISEHLVAVGILDALRDIAEVDIFDTTGYAQHRDDALAIAVAVDRQQQLRELRHLIGLS